VTPAAAQLPLAGVPSARGQVIEVIASYCGYEAEVAMHFTCVVDLGEREPFEPLVRVEGAVVVDTGDRVDADELAAMLRNDDFRQGLAGMAYSQAATRRNQRRRQ